MTRIAIVHKERCNPRGCGGYLCIRTCPINRMGKDCITVDPVDKKIRIDPKLATDACKICQNVCPFDAIQVIKLPEELTKQPIHQYGDNGFHLYSLPMPRFGQVVGILGRNGIGKSTAVKILASVLAPNLGKADEATPAELLEYFKGTESQLFFEKLKDGKITVSYKPQQVEAIPKQAKGTVRSLLQKVDERKKLDEIAQLLEVNDVLDADIGAISGGELQRVAIAATILKKANLYVFDEPTSYLDIEQRLKVANVIRSLADEETAVLVIEHDFITLDYMADLVHILFGNEGAYGIVSQLKKAKAGMNAYLGGFLKEENMQFRDKAIHFEVKPPFDSKKFHELTTWPKMKKQLGNFALSTEAGTIMKKEVVGVLGPNGIGKTSFMKLLAGVEKPDEGDADLGTKIAYKPQYIDSSSDELVMTVLEDAVKNYDASIIAPLNLKPLLNRTINHLSGGELQRVAIARCLSQECELLLLDEPSAYLDVEQRLLVAKIIKNIVETREVSAIIVDHDLLFLESLSDRLLVFSGEPAKHGLVKGPFPMEDGMNTLLKEMDITLRREETSGRPRINKKDSQKDKEQKSKGNYYYS